MPYSEPDLSGPQDPTINEFARLTNTSPITVKRNIRNGKIPSYKIGGARRIRAEVAEAIRRGEHSHDLAAEVRRIVELAPKLSQAQRDTIAAIIAELAGGGLDGAA